MDSGNTFGMRNFAVSCFLVISTVEKLFNMQHVKMIILWPDFSIAGRNEGRYRPELTPALPDPSRDSEGSVGQVGTRTLSKLKYMYITRRKAWNSLS
jgi:hypothetical protein